MLRISAFVLASMLSIVGCGASEPGIQKVSTRPVAGQPANPQVRLETSKGTITLELFSRNAPTSVANFVSYVKAGFYDGTVFHRVIPGFMIQGGGMTADMTEKPTRATIRNEANNGLKNFRGTLAMARMGEPHSASSQFFINVADNDVLDHRGENDADWGYAVFGKVISGMDVVDAIVSVPRGNLGPYQDVPTEPVLIKHATVIKATGSSRQRPSKAR